MEIVHSYPNQIATRKERKLLFNAIIFTLVTHIIAFIIGFSFACKLCNNRNYIDSEIKKNPVHLTKKDEGFRGDYKSYSVNVKLLITPNGVSRGSFFC